MSRPTHTTTAALAVMGATLVAGVLGAGAPQGERAERSDAGRFPVSRETTSHHVLSFTAAAGTARTLDLGTITGAIRLSAGTGNAVELDVRRRVRAATDADAREADRQVRVEIVEEPARVGAIVHDDNSGVCGQSSGRREWQRRDFDVTVDLTARVPEGTRLHLCTVTGGDVRVEGTRGDFEINHVNGPITLTAVRGSGRARTVNGGVSVSFARSPAGAAHFQTVNGDITVSSPGGLSADVQMRTMHGELLTDFDVEALPVLIEPVERDGTRSRYRVRDGVRVRVGAGGPLITAETLNGDVRLLRAPR